MNSSFEESEPRWPRHVRVLAVLHVIAPIFGFLSFLVLSLAAAVRFSQVGQWDERMVSLIVAALTCPVVAASYRLWFENWGRKRWPDGQYREHRE